MINHGWRKMFCSGRGSRCSSSSSIVRVTGWLVTMLAIVLAWVPFRADSIEGARNVLAGMFGLHGFVLPDDYFRYLNKLFGLGDYLVSIGLQFGSTAHFKGAPEVASLIILLFIVVVLPNTQQIMRHYHLAFETYKRDEHLKLRVFEWSPTLVWILFTACAFALAVLGLNQVSEFLYFQF